MFSIIAAFAFLILAGIAGAIAAVLMFNKKTEWPVYVEEIAPATPGFGANLASPNLDIVALREKSFSF